MKHLLPNSEWPASPGVLAVVRGRVTARPMEAHMKYLHDTGWFRDQGYPQVAGWRPWWRRPGGYRGAGWHRIMYWSLQGGTMNGWITLTSKEGVRVLMNLDHVLSVEPDPDGGVLVVSPWYQRSFQEEYGYVQQVIEEVLKWR